MKPIDARTDDQICKLEYDNFPQDHEAHTILIEPNEITLYKPHNQGRKIMQMTIPRDEWDVIVKWYMSYESKGGVK